MTDVILGRADAPRAFPRMHPGAVLALLVLAGVGLALLFTPEPGPATVALSLRAPLAVEPLHPEAVAPFVLAPRSAAERDRAIRCLTDAVYYEAAQEPVEGQRAVAQVVVNRVRDRVFPKSICAVVYQGWERGAGCQFSFACDGSLRRRPADPVRWAVLRRIAEQALAGYVDLQVGTATHYHAAYVRPAWLGSVTRVGQVGAHVFYSWRHKAGRPEALRFAYRGGEFAVPEAALRGERAG